MEKFKRFKEGAKKVLSKVGTFLNKGAKVVEKIQPIFKVVKDFVPYGEYIDKGIEIGQEVAEKAGRAMQSIGEGKDLGGVIKDTFNDFNEGSTGNFIKEKIIPKIKTAPKIISGIKTDIPNIDTIEPAKRFVNEIEKTNQPKIDNNTTQPKKSPQFLTKNPPKSQVTEPSFMKNVLNK